MQYGNDDDSTLWTVYRDHRRITYPFRVQIKAEFYIVLLVYPNAHFSVIMVGGNFFHWVISHPSASSRSSQSGIKNLWPLHFKGLKTGGKGERLPSIIRTTFAEEEKMREVRTFHIHLLDEDFFQLILSP